MPSDIYARYFILNKTTYLAFIWKVHVL